MMMMELSGLREFGPALGAGQVRFYNGRHAWPWIGVCCGSTPIHLGGDVCVPALCYKGGFSFRYLTHGS